MRKRRKCLSLYHQKCGDVSILRSHAQTKISSDAFLKTLLQFSWKLYKFDPVSMILQSQAAGKEWQSEMGKRGGGMIEDRRERQGEN